MIGDHHGWEAGRATLLVRTMDEIFGTGTATSLRRSKTPLIWREQSLSRK